jgi:UDP-N-acetylglucosamine diphosphorylase / glucose-1-phosphate thymidylyltransferase / UDP-N-acetylgalactosamine diphosphorylase / glucosamine-1-phosphate N-acetyltransferase / galactosamine-1-phosphate N-acetyltransferase
MKVVLLAAGRSTRMSPVKDKNFLEFLGKPLIEHQLKTLHDAGFADFFVVCGAHNISELEEFGYKSPYNVTCIEQKNLDDGMKGAVLSVRDHLEENEPILIVSSNDVVEVEAFELVNENSQVADGIDGFMVAKKVLEYFPGGYVAVDGDSILQQIVEKPGPGNEPSSLVNLVIHLWKNPSELFAFLDKNENGNDDAYELAISEMIKNDRKIKVLEYDGDWYPIKFPWHIFDVWKMLFGGVETHIADSAEIADSAVIKGNVIIEEGVKIFDNAVLNGPCYIGKNSVIANGSLVRDSHVGANCVVGYSTEIARSYLADHVWTHSNYIGDSVIGKNTSFGAGCVTGNLRLDDGNVVVSVKDAKIDTGRNKFGLICGENVRVGVNTSFMPGVKVGNDSFIGAGIFLNEDIGDSKFVYGKWDLVIKDNKTSASLEDREKMKEKL